MQTVNEKIQVFLRILLIIALKILVDLSNGMLKPLGHNHLPSFPHLLHQISEGCHKLTAVAEFAIKINLFHIHLIFRIILMQNSNVSDTLQG